MEIPGWANDLISREAEAYLQRAGPTADPALVEAVHRLRAWPVYGDIGGTLLLAADGTVYCQDHGTMEVALESRSENRLLAWVEAAEQKPELRRLLPQRPPGTPPCPACDGAGRVQLTPTMRVRCGVCCGLGWRGRRGF